MTGCRHQVQALSHTNINVKAVNCNSEEMTICIYTENNKHHTSAFSRQFI